MYGHTSESLGFPVGLSVPEGAIVAPQFQHFHPQPIPAGVTIFPGQPPVVEAVSSPLLPTTGLPPDVTELLVKARSSWLKGNELVQLLEYGIAGKFPLSAAAADMPPSGTLFLYDRKKVRFFRLDGHNWRKKHDGKTVRETHEKLKVDNVDKLNCYYAHALEPFNLQRRCYWLLENDKFVLVHYLETGFGTKRAANRWNELLQQQPEMSLMAETDSQGRPVMPAPGSSASMMQRRRCSLDSSRMSESSYQAGHAGSRSGRASFEETSRRHSSMDDSRDTYLLPPGTWQPHQQVVRLTHWAPAGQVPAMMPWQQPQPHPLNEHMLPWSAVPQSAAACCQMPKVPEHGQQLMQPQEFLTFQQAPPTVSTHPDNQSMDVDSRQHSASAQDMAAKRPSLDDSAISAQATPGMLSISDISPQVVSIHGGDKVLIVGSGFRLNSGGIYVEVDGVRCDCQIIGDGVISFHTKPHTKGLARIMIHDSAGHVISSSAAIEFAEPMLSAATLATTSVPPDVQATTMHGSQQ